MSRLSLQPAFVDHFGGRKSEDFAENPLPRISMFTSSRVWSNFGRISQQIRGYQIDHEYVSSTCDVMNCRQRRHLYYGGQI
jgi:hypothetical protein